MQNMHTTQYVDQALSLLDLLKQINNHKKFSLRELFVKFDVTNENTFD